MDIVYLADHPRHVATLAGWFAAQWPDYYAGRGPSEVVDQFEARLRRDGIPLALLALDGDEPVGTISLMTTSIPTHAHLAPWVGGLFVRADRRGRGLGMSLVRRAVEEARGLGVAQLYVAMHAAAERYEADGWDVHERTRFDDEPITVLTRALNPHESVS